MKIDEKEVPQLALRLQVQLDPHGIQLDRNRFEEMIREDNGEMNPVCVCVCVCVRACVRVCGCVLCTCLMQHTH